MFSALCKRANKKLDASRILVGIIVNIIIAILVDLVLSFFCFIGWLGTGFIVYLQFYLSGKSFLETIKKM